MTDPLQPDDQDQAHEPETPAWTPEPAAAEPSMADPVAAAPETPAWNAPALPVQPLAPEPMAPMPVAASEPPAWAAQPQAPAPATPSWWPPAAPAPSVPTGDPSAETTTQPTFVAPTPPYTPPAQPTYQQPQFQQPQFQQPGAYPQQGYVQPGAYPPQPGYPPGYQQPMYQQPGYPPYVAPTGYGSSVLVTIGGLLLVLIGLGAMALGGAIIAMGSSLGPVKELGMAGTTETGVGAGAIVFGFLAFIAGAGSLAHKSWARGLGMLVALVGIVMGGLLTFLATQKGTSGKIGEVIADLGTGQKSYVLSIVNGIVPLVLFAVILLALLAGGRHFRRM